MNKNRKIYCILALVTLIHVGGIVCMEYASIPVRNTNPDKRLIVKTVTLMRKKKASPKKKTVAVKTEVKKQAPPKKKPVLVKKQTKRETLLAEAKASFVKVTKKAPDRGVLDDIGVIESLKIDDLEKIAGSDQGYIGILAGCLRRSLRLPEFGDIRVSLCINSQGKVVETKILHAENENNRRYVEKVLPTVHFPPFGNYFKNEKTHTFTITLTNDI